MIQNDRLFQNIVRIIMILIGVFCLFPFAIMVVSSFTDEKILMNEGYSLMPKSISLSAYAYLLHNSAQILRAYFNTIIVTVIGTLGNLAITTLLAYSLSKKNLPHRNLISFVVFFTMLFNGGIVSSYIMWAQYFHVKNTYFALIGPNLLMSAFYVIMMRTYFSQNIPEEILEAARIDGAGEWQILNKMVLPMSYPIIITLTIFVGLQYWNDWINGLYFLTDDKFFTIQVMLNKMLQDLQYLTSSSLAASSNIDTSTMPTLGIKMSIAIIGMLPIICIYPFLQKYFVKGITIGAVKG